MTSATITGIDNTLKIGFNEPGLTSHVNLNLTSADSADTLNLAMGTTNKSYINLTTTTKKIKFHTENKALVEAEEKKTAASETEGTATVDTARATTNTVTVVTENGATYIVATGDKADLNTDDWVVQLAGVKSDNLSVAGGIVTVNLSTEA